MDPEMSLEIQAAAATDGAAPQPPKFTMTAYTGVAMHLYGFYYPVVVDLESMHKPSKSVPVLRNHDDNRIAGHTDTIEVSAQRIKATGVLSGLPEHTDEIIANAKNQFPWQCSIGASADKYERYEKGEEVKVNGRVWKGPVVVARGATLREISILPMGADNATAASVAAFHFGGIDSMEFSQWLAARKFDEAKLTEQEKTLLKAAFDAEVKPTPAPVAKPIAASIDVEGEMKKLREAAAAEQKRQDGIRAAVAKFGVTEVEIDGKKENLASYAIAAGWDADKAELHALRAGRPQGPHFHIPRTEEVNGKVLEAAVLQAGGFFKANPTKEKEYGDQVLQAAHTLYKNRIGLQQLLAAGARLNGYQGGEIIRDDGDIEACFHYGFRAGADRRIQASSGYSTSDISNVLANVQNKFLLDGYMHVDQSWREIAAIRSVKDFKPTKSVNLLSDVVFQEVGANGELAHGDLSDQAFANQAKTYGRMLAITRQQIINDDLSALTQVPRLIGRGSALKLNKVFWTQWYDNSTIFPTDNSLLNYYANAAAVLGSAGLSTVVKMFRDQKDPKNEILGVEPKILLVPTALETTAMELMKGINIVYGGAAADKQPNINIFAGRFKTVVSPYLTTSTTAWWLLADPLDMPLIECCFLSGNEVPVVQTAEASFNTLGIQMRGFFDFGVSWQNYRGGVMSKGAS